jgi:excisionase family DNA binding protein
MGVTFGPVAPQDFATLPEAAQRLGFDVETVEALVASGDLGSVRVQGERLVPIAALDEWRIDS